MADWTLMTVQLRGKARRFVQATLARQDTDALVAQRRGECNRCGACCKILFKCPFLGTDAEGQYTCRIYQHRFSQCRLYPLHAKDLLESLRASAATRSRRSPRVPPCGRCPSRPSTDPPSQLGERPKGEPEADTCPTS